MASYNPMSYFSPASVFSLSTFLPSYLVAAPEPQPEPPAETSEPEPEPDESEESGDSRRTEEVSLHSTDTQTEDKVNAELNNQNSEVFLALLTYFSSKYNDNDRLKLKLFSSLKKTPRVSWRRQRPVLSWSCITWRRS